MCIYVFLILPTDLNQYVFLYWKAGEGAIPTLCVRQQVTLGFI